jgi:hypothetical protein
MPNRAKSAFTIDNRETTPADWEGGQCQRARWLKTYTGELAGTGVLEAIMMGLEGGDPAVYMGAERIEGTLQGRKGSFVALHSATSSAGKHVKSWTILTGSGTDELAGISGSGEIKSNHDFVLEYELDS